MTGVNFVTNEKGQKTAVQISLKRWNDLQKDLKKLEILEDLKQAFNEKDKHVKGKLKSPTTKQLLSQL
jgi:seryl-tRNA(Sec) selenium transferase